MCAPGSHPWFLKWANSLFYGPYYKSGHADTGLRKKKKVGMFEVEVRWLTLYCFVKSSLDFVLLHKILYDKCDLAPYPFDVGRDSTTRASCRKLVLPKARTRFQVFFYRASSDFVKTSSRACVPYDTKCCIKLLDSYLNPSLLFMLGCSFSALLSC